MINGSLLHALLWGPLSLPPFHTQIHYPLKCYRPSLSLSFSSLIDTFPLSLVTYADHLCLAVQLTLLMSSVSKTPPFVLKDGMSARHCKRFSMCILLLLLLLLYVYCAYINESISWEGGRNLFKKLKGRTQRKSTLAFINPRYAQDFYFSLGASATSS